MGWASTNSSTGAAAKTIDDPSTSPMNPLDSLGITPIPAEDEALRPHLRAFLAQDIKDLPTHPRTPRRGRGVAPARARRSRAGHQSPAAPSARALLGRA